MPKTAERWGYLNRIFDANEIGPFVAALARRIATFPVEARAAREGERQQRREAACPKRCPTKRILFQRTLRTEGAQRNMKRFLEMGGQTREGELKVGELMAQGREAVTRSATRAVGDRARLRSGRRRRSGLAAVLLLHGFPQTSHSWRHQLPALAEAGYFAVAPNQRGYSPHARPSKVEAYSTDRLIADARTMAKSLGYARYHLVGHDWGGQLSWLIAAQFPRRTR